MKKSIKVILDNPFPYGLFPWGRYTEFIVKVPNKLFLTKRELNRAKKTKRI